MKGRIVTDSHSRVLTSLIAIGRWALRECEQTKDCQWPNFLFFALLAKLLSSARSIQVLVRHECQIDAKLIARSVLDGAIDLLFLLSDPEKRVERSKLFAIEAAADAHEEIQAEAARSGKSVKQLSLESSDVREMLSWHEKLKSKGVFQNNSHRKGNRRRASSNGLIAKRWMAITPEEKLEAIKELSKATKLFRYSIRYLGSAVTHSRPAALKEFAQIEKSGSVRFLRKAKASTIEYHPDWIAFEVTLWLLLACDRLVDSFFLSESLTGELQTILDRLKAIPKK